MAVGEVFSAACAGVPTKAHETIARREIARIFFMLLIVLKTYCYRYLPKETEHVQNFCCDTQF